MLQKFISIIIDNFNNKLLKTTGGLKMSELTVLEQKISYFKINDEDYISITDMLKSKDGSFFISDWLRNRNTIEFLGIWEEIHNPNFNYGEFAIIKS